LNEETIQTITPQTSKLFVAKKSFGKRKCDILKSEKTAKKMWSRVCFS
jgi:hypothetical protein